MGRSQKLANSLPAKAPTYGLFRSIILVLAFVLACQAFWILAAEFYRPAPVGFPTNTQSIVTAVAKRNAAHLAASIGFIRGDLWAEDALTYADIFLRDERDSGRAQSSDTIEQARVVAERALAAAPHDAQNLAHAR